MDNFFGVWVYSLFFVGFYSVLVVGYKKTVFGYHSKGWRLPNFGMSRCEETPAQRKPNSWQRDLEDTRPKEPGKLSHAERDAMVAFLLKHSNEASGGVDIFPMQLPRLQGFGSAVDCRTLVSGNMPFFCTIIFMCPGHVQKWPPLVSATQCLESWTRRLGLGLSNVVNNMTPFGPWYDGDTWDTKRA